MPSDLSTTNMWLAIIAVANAILLLALAAAAIAVIRLTRKASAVVDKVEQQAAPVLARANAVVLDAQHIVDEAKLVVANVKHAQQSVSGAVASVDRAVSRAAMMARSRLWPVIGVLRGMSAATSTLARRRPNGGGFNGRTASVEDEQARSVFVYEGGGSHAREPNV